MNMFCFFSTNNECSRVLHKFICVNQFLTACFSSYKYVTAIRDAAGKVYVVVKRVHSKKDRFTTKPVSKGRTFGVPYRSAELKKVQQLTT